MNTPKQSPPKHLKWWLNWIGTTIFLILCFIYLAVRPMVLQNAEPLIHEALNQKVNGSVEWEAVDLNPSLNLEFTNIAITDANGERVLSTPDLTVSWKLSALCHYLWYRDGILNVINGIEIDHPHLALEQESDGTWNVEHLLKPSSSSDSGELNSVISISDGAADIQLKDGTKVSASKVNTHLNSVGHQHYQGSIDGSLWNSQVKGTVDFTNSNKYSIAFSSDPIQLTSLSPLLNSLPSSILHSVNIDSGKGEVTSAKIWKDNGTLSYRVKGRLENTALSMNHYVLTDGAAFFDMNNNVLTLSEVKGKCNDQSFSGEVSVNLQDEPYQISGLLNIDHADLHSLLPDENISGSAEGQISISGTTENPVIDGSVQLLDLQYNEIQAKRITGAFHYSDYALDVERFKADAADGTLWGHGSYNVNSGAFKGMVYADRIHLEELPIQQNISGVMTGSVSAAGQVADNGTTIHEASYSLHGDNVSYEDASAGSVNIDGSESNGYWNADFTGQNVNAKGISVSSISGRIGTDLTNFDLNGVYGELNQGSFSLNGRYSPDGMNLQAILNDVDASAFSSLLGNQNISGLVSGNVTIGGTMDAPDLDGHIHVKNGNIMGIPVADLSGTVNSNDGFMEVHALCLTPQGSHKIDGKIGIAGDHALDLTISSEHVRLEDLLPLLPTSIDATGWLNNTIKVQGTVSAPSVAGDFMAWDGSIEGHLFQNLSGKYAYSNGNLTISDGLAFLLDGSAVFNGQLKDDALDFDIFCVDMNAGKLLPDLGIDGQVSLRGKLTGALDNPSFNGVLSSRALTKGKGKVSNLVTGINYENHLLNFYDGSFHQGSGTFNWTGNYDVNSGLVSGKLDFTHWDFPAALRFINSPLENVNGYMDGTLTVSGTTDDPNVALKAAVTGGHLGHTVVGQGNIDISYIDKSLTIKELDLPVGTGSITAKGTMSNQGDLNIGLNAKDVDISWIPEILGKRNYVIQGALTANIQVVGNKSNPKADISVDIDHPRYGDFAFDDVSILGNIQNGALNLHQGLIKRNPYKVTASGQIPMSFLTRIDTGKNVPFDLNIDLDQADLTAIALLNKSVTSASGPIAGHIHVDGPWDDPAVHGSVSAENGVLTVLTMDDPISINFNAAFNGKSAELDGNAAFGGGEANLKGSVAWDHMQLSQYAGEFHMHVPNIQSEYYKGAFDSDLALTDIYGHPGIAGTIDIHDATMDLPYELLMSSGGTPVALPVNIQVNVKNNTTLYNSALYNLAIRGNIDVQGTLADPFISGQIATEDGTIQLNTTTFDVTEGRAIWGGLPGTFLPDIHVKAQTKVGHYDVKAALDGPPGSMKTELSSSPHLSDSQLLMLLALRQDPDQEGSTANQGALFNAGLTLLFGNGVQDFMKDKIGLDYVSISSDLTDSYDAPTTDSDAYYIKIGKYLFNNFMLTATMGMNNDDKSVGARYKLNTHAGISTWYTSNHDGYIGADWSFKF